MGSGARIRKKRSTEKGGAGSVLTPAVMRRKGSEAADTSGAGIRSVVDTPMGVGIRAGMAADIGGRG